MTGAITAAAITAGAALAGTGASLYSSSQARNQAAGAANIAGQQQSAQAQLQQEMMDRQFTLATAGQTDARGNQLVYDPTTNTWKTVLSPEGQALLARSDAITRMHDVQTLGRGQSEQSQAFQRRQAEGSTASPILDQLRYGYGAPTREGVLGANKIAGVTGASENADTARAGYTGAALRTGFGYAPLEHTLAGVDKASTTGQRTALAQVDAQGNSIYNTALNEFQTPRANMYNALATRASNTENIPFSPSNIPDTTDAALLNRAVRGPASTMNPYAGSATNTATKNLLDAIGGQQQLPIGGSITTLGDAAKKLYEAWNKQPDYSKPPPGMNIDDEIRNWSNYGSNTKTF